VYEVTKEEYAALGKQLGVLSGQRISG
jgi:hypothetical protein